MNDLSDKKQQYQPWWMRRIRGMSYFSFRYWWFVWLLFLLAVLLFVLKCCSTPEEKGCGDNYDFTKRFNAIDSLLYNCCDCNRETPTDSLTFPADYLILTYQFDQSGGRDLDTRTRLLAPVTTNELGWCKPNFNSDLIIWSGDNTGYGVESCLIDLTKFSQNDRVDVSCGAIWFGQRNSGNMSIDVRAFKGGTMTKTGYQFENVGGEETAFISFADNITLKTRNCPSNELIGTISYDKRTESLSFTPR